MSNGDGSTFNFWMMYSGESQVFVQIIFGNQVDFTIVRYVFGTKSFIATFHDMWHVFFSLDTKRPIHYVSCPTFCEVLYFLTNLCL